MDLKLGTSVLRITRGLLLKPTLNLLEWLLKRDGNSVIIGGPLGWSWQPTIDAAHHGSLLGPANAHRHQDLANIGPDDHHARDHATRHQDGGADEISLAGLDGEPTALTTHKNLSTGVHGVGTAYIAGTTVSGLDLAAHKTRHQSGGADELSLDASQIASGRFVFIDLHLATSDPAATAGRFWWREDLKALRLSDGTETLLIAQTLPKMLRAGRYYGSFDVGATLGTLTVTANRLYAAPLLIPSRYSFDRIAINVTGAAAGSARMGIYRDGGAVYPTTLVSGTDVGAVDTGTTGVKENVIAVTLNPGLYWLAFCASATPIVRALLVAAQDSEILGLDSTLGTASGVGFGVAYTFAALPATFPAGATVDTGSHPLVAIRRA